MKQKNITSVKGIKMRERAQVLLNMMSRVSRLFFGVALFLALLVFGCSKDPGKQPKGIQVVASIFPLYDFAREVGGDKIQVTLLLPPGMEAHSFEPRPAQLDLLQRADIFLLTHPAMEPWASDLIKGLSNNQLAVIDTSRGVKILPLEGDHDHDHAHDHKRGSSKGRRQNEETRIDPHFWLDFDNAAKMTDNIARALAEKNPSQSAYFQGNAEKYKKRLADLDTKYRSALAACPQRLIVSGGHAAFRYAAQRYNLGYISAYNFSPNAEPAPRELIKIIKLVKKHGIRYIFHEELIQPRVAQSLSAETGAALLLLHGAHNITKEEYDRNVSFITIMEANLNNLKTGLLCP